GYYDCADGPVKSYVFPDRTSNRVYLSTTNRVWALADGGGSVSLAWSSTAAPGPSTPLFVQSYGLVYAGSSDGRLVQLNSATGAVQGTPATLGAGGAVVGIPSFDTTNGLVYVGTDSGAIYSASVPLP